MVSSPSETPTAQAGDDRVLAPHGVIHSAYSTIEEKRTFVNTIFDATAQDYDRVERWLSLNTGRWYREQALKRAGLAAGMNVCDVAIGTGLVADGALKVIGESGTLIGVDPSPEMMRFARQKLGVQTVRGIAEKLPFDDATFDFLSMGYALRHIEDLNVAFREFRRVLKPGGRLCILEITRPNSALGRAALKFYLGTCSRVLGGLFNLAPRTPELWAYYWETIDGCVPPQRVMQAIADAGFSDVKRHKEGPIFSEYTAVR